MRISVEGLLNKTEPVERGIKAVLKVLRLFLCHLFLHRKLLPQQFSVLDLRSHIGLGRLRHRLNSLAGDIERLGGRLILLFRLLLQADGALDALQGGNLAVPLLRTARRICTSHVSPRGCRQLWKNRNWGMQLPSVDPVEVRVGRDGLHIHTGHVDIPGVLLVLQVRFELNNLRFQFLHKGLRVESAIVEPGLRALQRLFLRQQRLLERVENRLALWPLLPCCQTLLA
mmetsp:Transcript_79130/g.219942  ORF Transcript_79130/g.219942 Transcript_79130/m.219942 type:complete len:228 (+) Transcript_79130:525-1208(+)